MLYYLAANTKCNSQEEISKRALSEKLAKEVAEFEKRKKITELPCGFSYEQKSNGFTECKFKPSEKE